jgi:hypothetical protein
MPESSKRADGMDRLIISSNYKSVDNSLSHGLFNPGNAAGFKPIGYGIFIQTNALDL